MSDQIIVAVLALLGTLAGSWFANRRMSALLDYRLREVEKKVERLDQTQELAAIRERLAQLEARSK